ncbi:DUF1674 domain-containing protein [Stenotrophomonas rhizophila]|uniref:DUF1674 domain-containing protein n=1 Tax=Stenotrophomonas rhizophila TaxID=216778 RepID=UPI001E48C6C6|nr:DUF1674 domain-containing protein [Stenotrophomonas rhizophila]MCC7635904.1 DUF1674 domain-containing protein [Stenotrophomonas rhizophila]MCC7665119.1 DUF1674 domain-containing protein [Stenotrophomonas rhizophila]
MIGQTTPTPESEPQAPQVEQKQPLPQTPAVPVEIGGRGGLDPVRYGDWEKNGRCIDF